MVQHGPRDLKFNSRLDPSYIYFPLILGAIDERIISLLKVLFRGGNRAIPLNAWETLLLLSNRERGVKFLFGNDKDYHAQLRQVPNLVVFDATGHRLNALDRGEEEDNNDPTATTCISRWKATSRKMHHLVKAYWIYPFKTLRERATPLEVANRSSRNSGSIMYPVVDNKPYDINMMKILNLPRSMSMQTELQKITDKANGKIVGWWTGPFFPYFTEGLFRPDITNRIRMEYPGFATGSVFICLSSEQGRAMEVLINQYSDKGRRGELPLSHVPNEAIASNPALQGDVGKALLLAMQYHFATLGENGEGPIVSGFRYR